MKKNFEVDNDFELVRGSGNIFRDFGHANADLEQARAILAKEIIQALDDRGLSTREAEKLTGVAHSEFSRIRNAKLSRFTLDRMITIFGKLVEDVEVNISFRPRHQAEPNGLCVTITMPERIDYKIIGAIGCTAGQIIEPSLSNYGTDFRWNVPEMISAENTKWI